MTLAERLALITDLRTVMSSLGIFDPNIEIFKQEIIDRNNEALVSQLETEWTTVEAQKLADQAREEKRALGEAARKLCDRARDIIAGWNIQRDLSEASIDQMISDYSDVLQALQSFRPTTALALIQTKTPDGTLVTQEMIDEVVAELQKGLGV